MLPQATNWGKRVGDWFEEYFVSPVSGSRIQVGRLFLDRRFRTRNARGEKIVWADKSDGNDVDYDFVMEIGGTSSRLGIPIAFLSVSGGADRDTQATGAARDSGKLCRCVTLIQPQGFSELLRRATSLHPPANCSRIATPIKPALRAEGKVISAFDDCGLVMDYPIVQRRRKSGSSRRSIGR